MNSVAFSSLRHGLVALAVGVFAFGQAQGVSPRLRIRFDADWRFRRDPVNSETFGTGPFHWTWKPARVETLRVASLPADLGTGDWREAQVGRNVFRGEGFAWYRTDLGHDSADRNRVLHFDSVDDNCEVFLNGVLLTRHEGWDDPFDVAVAKAWNSEGPNALVVLVENTGGGGGIMGRVDFAKSTPADLQPVAPGYDDQGWRRVHLPHDYVVEGTFTPKADTSHGSLPTPSAWYRKAFVLPAAYRGKSVWIDFEGVYRNSTVYLNGHELGNQPSGYTGFRYDIGRYANFGGRNVLAVRVVPHPQEGWFYEGGGIYRHVWLNVADPVHVAPWGVFVRPEVEGREGDPHPAARLNVEVTVTNAAARPVGYSVESRVISPEGRMVASIRADGLKLRAGWTLPVRQRVEIAGAELWSLEQPRLYRLETAVRRDGKVVDRETTPFGIRSLRYDADRGFFLNGKHVELKGTCNHQDFAGLGVAVPDGLEAWRVKRLKEMGCNAWRMSHNPPNPELLDACDRLGMLVMDEARHLGDTSSPKSSRNTPYNDLGELKAMLLRDRNHPSIVMWSMCNEEPLEGSAAGARIFAAMEKVTKAMDPSRPVTSAMNGGWESKQGFAPIEDLLGFNYGIYAYDKVRAMYPGKPMFGSETASTVSTRGIYANDPVRGYVSAYDANYPGWAATAEQAWEPIARRPWMEGGFVWTGFDYKGEPTPYGWPCINSHFGILDICGFPKDNFYYYKAWWGDKPIVHLLPHWNWRGKEGQPIDVWAYANADAVELFLNGRSLGAQPMPPYEHVAWKVPYAPGVLVAKAYRKGRVVATDRVETTGAPVALRLKTAQPTLLADREEVSPVEVEVVDAKGRVVPTAGNPVAFAVSAPGEVAGVGNGDPSSHEPDKASRRNAFNGLCMVIVRARSAGRIVLRATSPGLKGATLVLTSHGSPMDR